MLDQLPNPTPALLDQLSQRLRIHIGQPKKKEPKFHMGKYAGVTVSVSTALREQVQQYINAQSQRPSMSAVVQAAVTKFITRRPNYLCPVKFTPSIKFAPRNKVFSANFPITIYEELEVFATERHLTVSAVVRRAVYEYTKPDQHWLLDSLRQLELPDPVAAIDAWADREVQGGKRGRKKGI